MESSKRRGLLGMVGTYVLWIFLSIVTLLPIYWLFVVSARSRVELFQPGRVWQTTFYAQNYLAPLSRPAFQRYLTNSLIVASSNALIVAFLALLATYALSRWKLQGADNIFFWTITNRMAPAAAFVVPLYLLFTRWFRIGDASLFDTRIGLILLYCIFNLPFAIWLLKGILDGIPIELDEAALVDGASRWTILWRVILPLAAPGVAIAVILCWIFAWNEYVFAATMTASHARTITTGLAEFVTVTGTNWGEMAAVAVISMLPSLVLLVFVQRYIVVGLTFGAVKE